MLYICFHDACCLLSLGLGCDLCACLRTIEDYDSALLKGRCVNSTLALFLPAQFYSVSPYLEDHPEYPEEDGSAPLFAANMAYLLHNEAGARFYFVRGAFTESKF